MITQDRIDDRDRARAGPRRPAAAAAHASSRPSSTPPSTRSPPRWRAAATRSATTSRWSTATSRELNPQLPTIQEDIARPRRRRRDLRRRRARPAAHAAQLRRSPRSTIVDRSEDATPASSPAPPASPTTHPAAARRERATGSSSSAAVGRPTLELLRAGTRPEYPCLLAGPGRSPNDFIGKTFANGELHITLEVDPGTRAAYQPGRGAGAGASTAGPTATACRSPPRPRPGQPLPGRHRTATGSASGAVPGFLRRPAERSRRHRRGAAASSTRWSRPQMGVPADDVPDLATLLFGPMARGTAVRPVVKTTSPR